MRLSTNLFFQRGLDSLQTSQSQLDKIQLMLTKQTKILVLLMTLLVIRRYWR